MRHSIQLQLQLWHGLLLAIVLIAFGSLSYEIAFRDTMERVDRQLNAELDQFLASGAIAPALHSNYYFLLLDENGRTVSGTRGDRKSALLPLVQRYRATTNDVTPRPAVLQGTNREVHRALANGDAILLGRSLDAEFVVLRRKALFLGLAALAMLTLGLAGGWFLTRRALSPLNEISQTATEIAAGDLGRRIAVTAGPNELTQLANVLNTSFAQMEASFERQARFTSDVSHELRTPIAMMLAKTQQALAGELTVAQYQEALRECQNTAARMQSLTESLLSLSRLEANAAPVSEDLIDLSALANDAVAQLEPSLNAKSLHLHIEGQTATTRGDFGRLSQVFINLLRNAIQFTPNDGHITIRTAANTREAVLTMEDTGPGISTEDLPRIFERFFRANPRQQGLSGAGLGLPISLAIIQSHGGSLTASNRDKGGARFEVRLPLVA